MPGIDYQHTVVRKFTDFWGEHLSVKDFGATGDGVTDDAPFINNAIAVAAALGGRGVFFPGGYTYKVDTPIIIPPAAQDLLLKGDGDSSVIKRGADMPDGQGVVDLDATASHVTFSKLKLDGDVTTHTEYQYGNPGDFNNDPMHNNLTKNTTFWLHGGVTDIHFDSVTITHTGGYAILLDSTTANIFNVTIKRCVLVNNRPHGFGTTPGNLTHGSWTGGIHAQGDGTNYATHNLLVEGCEFSRMMGNAVWTHLYAFGKIHRDIKVKGNHFTDLARDGVLIGGVIGGVVEGNTFSRIGYICTDDTTATVPDYLGGNYAVALDTAGLVRNVNYVNNSFLSVNGGCMDLDGFAEGSVVGNSCIIPFPGDPEYTADQITAYANGAGNLTYGLQVSNSNNNLAGRNVTVVGNSFINMGRGAIAMYASRQCLVQGNFVKCPDVMSIGKPIILGNIGTTANLRSYDNVVVENTIEWNVAAQQPAVYEDAQYGAFNAADKNWVSGNKLIGPNLYEFMKDANTASTTAVVLSSSGLTLSGFNTRSESYVRRETLDGTGQNDGNRWDVLRWWNNLPSSTDLLMSLYDPWLGGGVDFGPHLQVSKNGVVNTGSISTGNRTQLAWNDAIATGKLFADGLFVLASTNYSDADANLLDDNYAMFRRNSTTGEVEISTTTSLGARVWSAIGGGVGSAGFITLPGKAEADVGVSLAGQSRIYYDQTLNVTRISENGGAYQRVVFNYFPEGLALTATGTALNVVNGWIETAQGLFSSAAFTNTVNVPYGGVTAKWFIGTESFTMTAVVEQASMKSGLAEGRIIFDGTMFRVSTDGGDFADLMTSPAQYLVITGAANALQLTNGYIYTASGYDTDAVSQEAIKSRGQSGLGGGGIACREINIYRADGGVTGYDTIVDGARNVVVRSVAAGTGAPTLDGLVSATLGLWTNDTRDNAVAVPFGGVTARDFYIYTVAGGPTKVKVIDSNASASFANAIVGTITSAGAGTVSAENGFYSDSTAWNALTLDSGGVYALGLSANFYTQVGQSNGVPTALAGGVLGNGTIYYDTGLSKLRAYEAGAWVDVIGGGGSSPPFPSGTVLVNSTVDSNVALESFSAIATVGPSFRLRRTRGGTADNQVGDQIPMIINQFWRSGWHDSLQIMAEVEAVGSTWAASLLRIRTRNTSGGFQDTMVISADGNTTITGYYSAATGFLTTSAVDNAVNIPNGGVWANKIISNSAVYVKTGGANPPGGWGGMRWSSGTVYQFWNGVGWTNADLGGLGGLPQPLAPTDSPTFAGLTITGAANSLQLTNGYVQAASGFYTPVNSTEAVKVTVGGVSARSINIYQASGGGAAWQVIDSNGTFVGRGVTCQSDAIGGASFAVWNVSGWSYGADGSFTTTDGKTVLVKGGIIYYIG